MTRTAPLPRSKETDIIIDDRPTSLQDETAEPRPNLPVLANPATRSIIVNGRRHVVPSTAIDHASVVRLAFPATGSSSHLVTFRDGPLERPEGFLVPGHGMPIVEDQVFNVAAAVQS